MVSVVSVVSVLCECEGKSLIALYLKPRWEVVTPFPVWKTPLHHFELCNICDIFLISFISFTCSSQYMVYYTLYYYMMKFIMIISFDLWSPPQYFYRAIIQRCGSFLWNINMYLILAELFCPELMECPMLIGEFKLSINFSYNSLCLCPGHFCLG